MAQKKEIDKIILTCPLCQKSSIYTLKDMTRVCKICGHRWKEVQK